MEKTYYCDECPRTNCAERVAGAVCSIKGNTKALAEVYKTRDPMLLVQMFASVVESEIQRYNLAKSKENIGGVEKKEIVDDLGRVKIVTSERKVDPAISKLAANIIGMTKVLNEIVNPKKVAPMFQQNNQFNLGTNVVADDIRTLKEDEKEAVLKFIEAKVNEEHN